MNIRHILPLSLFLCAPAHATYIIDQPLTDNDGIDNVNGQSFTPNDPLTSAFPTSMADLRQFTFYVVTERDHVPLSSTPTYLLIYQQFAGGVGSGLLGASDNTQTWVSIGYDGLVIFDFASGVLLDKDTTYYAVFSESSSDILNSNRAIQWNSFPDMYSGGSLLLAGGALEGNYDARFTATFATSVVPEGSSTLAALGIAVASLLSLGSRGRQQKRWAREAEQARCSEPGDGALAGNRGSVAPGH